MRISHYPTDTITGTEFLIGTDDNNGVGPYTTKNFTLSALKTYFSTGNTNTALADNAELQCGASQDLRIFHDGTNSYIRNATGTLYIATESANVPIIIGHGSSEVTIGDNLNINGTLTFEGATSDAHETTLGVIDPDGDRTINLPNQSGTLPVLAVASTTAITSTPEEINILDGVTATANELNILDGVTSTAAELNILDASAGNTAVASDVATSSGNVASGADHYKLSHTLTLNAALADDAEHADITITNNKVLATSVVLANTSVNANIDVHTVVAGSFKIRITNKSGGTLADDSTMVINYRVL